MSDANAIQNTPGRRSRCQNPAMNVASEKKPTGRLVNRFKNSVHTCRGLNSARSDSAVIVAGSRPIRSAFR